MPEYVATPCEGIVCERIALLRLAGNWWALLALGQVEGMPNWLSGTTTVSGTLVLGWFVWHTLTKTIPEMQRTFETQMDSARKAFTKVLEDHDSRHEREMSSMRDMVDKLQGMLHESMQSDRRAVHDFRDTANQVVTEARLAIKKQEMEGAK